MYVHSSEPNLVPVITPNLKELGGKGHTVTIGERMSRLAKFPKKDPSILLLEPLYPVEASWGSVKIEQGFLPPLGTISIFRYLIDKGFRASFLDTQFGDFTESSLKEYLKHGEFDMVGIPLFTPTADYVFDTARIIKEVLPDCVVVYGGVHATSLSVETLGESVHCDFVIRREGETTIKELIDALMSGTSDFSHIKGLTWRKSNTEALVNPDRLLLPDLDELPLGMYGDLDLSRYVPHPTQYIKLPNYPMVTQRGCPYKCTFCEAHVALGKKLRLFSVDRVIEELKILKYEKGAKGIYFQDSTFTLKKKYVVPLFEAMVKEGLNDMLWSCTTRTDRVDPDLLALMYEAGCRNILYGIESGNDESLKIIKKNISVERQAQGVEWTHKAKITMTNSFILALPGETEEMVQNTINYAKQLGAQMSLFYLPVPYPGTDLYQSCLESGGIREHASWKDFLSIDFDDPIYVNPLIGKERMQYWYKRAFIEYYSSPRVWKNNIKALTWNGGVSRCLRGANALRALVMHNSGNFFKQAYHGSSAPRKHP